MTAFVTIIAAFRLPRKILMVFTAALAFLKTVPDIDAKRPAIAGHSFGGQLYLAISQWKDDVFKFIDQRVKQ